MMLMGFSRRKFLSSVVLVAATGVFLYGQAVPRTAAPNVLDYIKTTWTVLTRSNKDLAKAVPDPKFQPESDGRWPLYVPGTDNAQAITQKLRQEMTPQDFKKVIIRTLPADWQSLKEQGLLYLPQPYVVPGGRFNEMYGWDSYFIQVGLLRDHDFQLAKDMTDNFLYQVLHYGKVLNANRTYYLSRSQPPFLTEMVLNVYNHTKDKKWLADAVPMIEKYDDFWMKGPHLTAETGLSRYWDFGEGPAPESVSAERDAQGKTHYDLVRDYFKTHEVKDYDVNEYYDRKADQLKPLFYKSDRTMRESGVDPSNRFGPFNIDIIHYNPVCLNSLLYAMEQQTAQILDILGRGSEAIAWRKKANDRAERVNRLMWDAKDGLYYDYNFIRKGVRHYPYLTTFYPMWAGLATKEQAARIVKNLPLFEKPGGLQTSTLVTGEQWDAPFGWAPLHMIALGGLRKYGYNDEAERISLKFCGVILKEFLRQGYIVEKYDVVNRGSDVAQNIHFGYGANQAGFGWTNAAFTQFYDLLTSGDQRKLLSGNVH
jgi:alpha,alpha-trehalase